MMRVQRTAAIVASMAERDVPGREVGSPCISLCVMNPELGYCIGCFRTLDEIADWINLDSAARLAVWDAIAERRASAANDGQ